MSLERVQRGRSHDLPGQLLQGSATLRGKNFLPMLRCNLYFNFRPFPLLGITEQSLEPSPDTPWRHWHGWMGSLSADRPGPAPSAPSLISAHPEGFSRREDQRDDSPRGRRLSPPGAPGRAGPGGAERVPPAAPSPSPLPPCPRPAPLIPGPAPPGPAEAPHSRRLRFLPPRLHGGRVPSARPRACAASASAFPARAAPALPPRAPAEVPPIPPRRDVTARLP